MNEKIRKHVSRYNAKNGWSTDDDSIIETILESKRIWTGNESDRRWWTDCFSVVEVDGMFIGFNDAKTTGGDSARDKGWEFDPSSICEAEPWEKRITIFRPKAKQEG